MLDDELSSLKFDPMSGVLLPINGLVFCDIFIKYDKKDALKRITCVLRSLCNYILP